MKSIFTLLLLTIFSFAASSQTWRMTGNYNLGLPQEQMGKNIQAAHGLQAGIFYQLPGKLKQLLVGMELGVGTYASERIHQTFQFSNNVAAVVPVNYLSNMFNANLKTRLNLPLSKKNWVVPYIDLKGGLYSFFSNIRIDDPESSDGCSALQHENIISDKTLYWSGGVGIQIDPVIFAKPPKHSGRVMIDLSINTIRGGKLDYINTKRLQNAQDVSTNGGKPMNVQFINASTQEIHEHTVAQVYTSPLRMLEIRAGVTVSLGND